VTFHEGRDEADAKGNDQENDDNADHRAAVPQRLDNFGVEDE
jgi:hypothetical protein